MPLGESGIHPISGLRDQKARSFTPILCLRSHSRWLRYGSAGHIGRKPDSGRIPLFADLVFLGAGLLVFAIAGVAVAAAARL